MSPTSPTSPPRNTRPSQSSRNAPSSNKKSTKKQQNIYILNELKKLRITNQKLLKHIESNNRRIDELEQYIFSTEDSSVCSDTLSLNSTFEHDKGTIFGASHDESADVPRDEECAKVVPQNDKVPKMSEEYQQHYEMMLMRKQFMEDLAAASPLIFSPLANQASKKARFFAQSALQAQQQTPRPLGRKRVHFENCAVPATGQSSRVEEEDDEDDDCDDDNSHECGILLSSNDLSRDESTFHNQSISSPHVESLPSSIQDMSTESISELKFPSHSNMTSSHLSTRHVGSATKDHSSLDHTSLVHSPLLLRKIQDLEQKVNLLLQQQYGVSPLKSQHMDVSSIFSDPASSFKKLIEFSTQDQSLLDRLFPDRTQFHDETTDGFSRVDCTEAELQ